MMVKELIEKLQTYDPELKVFSSKYGFVYPVADKSIYISEDGNIRIEGYNRDKKSTKKMIKGAIFECETRML